MGILIWTSVGFVLVMAVIGGVVSVTFVGWSVRETILDRKRKAWR